MTGYDGAEWVDFANTVAGGAAALAGLLFVGLSLNLAEVLRYPGVSARAAATLGVTIAMLLAAIFRRHAWSAASGAGRRDRSRRGLRSRRGAGGRALPA